jgi:hypothetical protein
MTPDDIRAIFAAFQQGDFSPFVDALATDAVWTVPGRSRLAGEYKGLEAILGLFGRTREVTNGTYKQQLRDILTSDDRVGVLYRAIGEGRGKSLDTEMLLLCQLDGDKVTSLTVVPRDAAAFEAFWG